MAVSVTVRVNAENSEREGSRANEIARELKSWCEKLPNGTSVEILVFADDNADFGWFIGEVKAGGYEVKFAGKCKSEVKEKELGRKALSKSIHGTAGEGVNNPQSRRSSRR
jgi:hypothetical protein